MIGDKLVINDYHKKGAELVFDYIQSTHPTNTLCTYGFRRVGIRKIRDSSLHQGTAWRPTKRPVTILGQDDYFRLPPHSNHQQRKSDLSWVGPREVQLDLMDYHISKLLDPQGLVVVKPLVHFEENIISTEAVQGPFDVVIAEGTYTALLAKPLVKAFINRDFRETKKDRLARNRDQALENGQDQALTFLEEVLTIEHEEIRKHKELASLIIPAPADI